MAFCLTARPYLLRAVAGTGFESSYFQRVRLLADASRLRKGITSNLDTTGSPANGLTVHQLQSLDATLEFFSSRPTGNALRIPRPDGTAYLAQPAQLEARHRPGGDRALLVLQAAQLGFQPRLAGVSISGDTSTFEVSVTVSLSEPDGTPIGDPAAGGGLPRYRVTIEISIDQDAAFVGISGGVSTVPRTGAGTYSVEAAYSGVPGQFEVRMLAGSSTDASRSPLQHGDLDVAVVVEKFDATGQPFATDGQLGFFPFYGSTERPTYAGTPPADPGFVGYTRLEVPQIFSFEAGYPTAIEIKGTSFQVVTGAVIPLDQTYTLRYVAIMRPISLPGRDEIDGDPAHIPDADEIINPALLPAGLRYVSGNMAYNPTAADPRPKFTVSGVTEARVYDVFIHVDIGTGLLGALRGIRTRDVTAPGFTGVELQTATPGTLIPTDAQLLNNEFMFDIRFRTDEPALVRYTVFRNCDTCASSPTVQNVLDNASICTQSTAAIECFNHCDPVIPSARTSGQPGSVTLQAVTPPTDGTYYTALEAEGTESMTGVFSRTPIPLGETTQCFTRPTPSPCATFTVYAVASDNVGNDVDVTWNRFADACSPVDAALTPVGYVAARECQQAAVGASDTANSQAGDWALWTALREVNGSNVVSTTPDTETIAEIRGRPLAFTFSLQMDGLEPEVSLMRENSKQPA